jgi:hypothetical protein
MNEPGGRGVRKRLLEEHEHGVFPEPGLIDLSAAATLAYSSEHPAHPVEHLLDGRDGPGGSRWVGARTDTTERVVVEFDRPHPVSRLVYEAEETERERTQEVHVEASTDGGRTYRRVLVQEYTFSPGGATFQREDLRLDLEGVTNLRLTVVPDKHGSGVATLTSLRLFA